MKLVLIWLGALLLICGRASAVDLSWSGKYRTEGVYIKNPTMDGGAQSYEKSYILHHLIMEPKIIPQDGITIKSRFDIFNNALGRNQAGQFFGSYTGPINSSGNVTGDSEPTTTTKTLDDESLAVTELYAIWSGEFGGLLIGRMPMQFGLGMTHSAGAQAFDHWHDTRDAIIYKFVIGNLSISPGYAKIRESGLLLEEDVSEFLVDVSYEDPERDLKMGFLFDHRTAPLSNATAANPNGDGLGADIPVAKAGTLINGVACTPGGNVSGTGYVGDCGSTRPDGFNVYLMNFFLQKKVSDAFNFGIEAGFQSGYTGIKTFSGERVEWSGFGIAAELNYKPSTFGIGLKAGLASGDDPESPRIEGYYFSRNYDIGMLMFNHVLGGRDVVGSAIAGTRNMSGTTTGALRSVGGLDNEVITNAIYVAPTFTLSASDRWDWMATIVWATQQKQTPPVSTALGGGSADKNLGFETDLGWRYHPTERFTMGMDLALLFPGNAWRGAGTGYTGKNEFVYGLTTKAAVSF